MNKAEMKKTILEALRSDKYTQYYGTFKDRSRENCFCAIGVIGDVLKEDDEDHIDGVCTFQRLFLNNLDEAGNFLWAEIVERNDVQKLTLPQIADYLEEALVVDA
jgi:hypothetical protein